MREPITVPRGVLRRAVAAAAFGNAMEWFDFGLYNYMAITIGEVFFPALTPSAARLAALGAFTAAFVARPLGGAVLGPLGDRIGRRRVLSATMILMAAATLAIGLIPSHARIGLAAPALLLLARLVQGFSTGGEYGGAVTFVAEYAPCARRGLMGSWLEFGTCAGFLLGAGAASLTLGLLPPEAVRGWGWRLPFLLAGPLGAIGFYIRMRLEETPAFAQAGEARGPGLARGLRENARGVALCMALVTAFNVPDFIVLSYMPTYLAGALHVPPARATALCTLALAGMTGLVPLAGHLSDRVGRRAVIAACSGAFLLFSVPCFLLIGQGGAARGLGLGVLGVALAGLVGVMPATLAALFPTRIRYGALAIAYNMAICLFGGTSLPIVEALLHRTGDLLVPAYYLMGVAAIGLGCAAAMRETAGRALPGSPGILLEEDVSVVA